MSRRAEGGGRQQGGRQLGRTAGLTVAAGVVLVLLFAVVFSIARGSRDISTDAGALHSADEALRAATVARAQIALAVHMTAVDQRFATSSQGPINISMKEASLALEDLSASGTAFAEQHEGGDELMGSTAAFTQSGEAILGLLGEGRWEEAQALAERDLSTRFQVLSEALVAERNELNDDLAAKDSWLGKLGSLTGFLVAFLVPTAVILLYRELVRRQQKQAELETRLAAEHALRRARDEFVASASHELRTPLTSIYGFAHVLEEDEVFDGAEHSRELVSMIISETSDLSRIVEDLLTTARIDAGALRYQYEDVEISEEIDEVIAVLVRSGVDVTADYRPAKVRADRLRLRQIIRNLLSNARKYGGPHIRVSGRVEDGWYLCIVADDGQGIAEESEQQLFQRFASISQEVVEMGSVGLGLSIVQKLAEDMDGSVEYRREKDWTEFVVRLPLAEATAGVGAADGDGGWTLAAASPLET